MATNATQRSLNVIPSQVEWRYALGLFTTAMFLLGALTFFRLLLPNHLFTAEWIALGVTFIWRLGVHKLGLFPWDWSRARCPSFSLRQAFIEGFAFFVFMLVVLTIGETSVSLVSLALAAVGGLAAGVYSGWYAPPKPISS